MSKHTPGPWRVHWTPQITNRRIFMPDDTVEIRKDTGHTLSAGLIACLYKSNWAGADEANANLIAAAPEMYAVLRAIEAVGYHNSAQVRAVLDKAEGRS